MIIFPDRLRILDSLHFDVDGNGNSQYIRVRGETASVSVAIKDVEQSDWKDEVWDKYI